MGSTLRDSGVLWLAGWLAGPLGWLREKMRKLSEVGEVRNCGSP